MMEPHTGATNAFGCCRGGGWWLGSAASAANAANRTGGTICWPFSGEGEGQKPAAVTGRVRGRGVLPRTPWGWRQSWTGASKPSRPRKVEVRRRRRQALQGRPTDGVCMRRFSGSTDAGGCSRGGRPGRISGTNAGQDTAVWNARQDTAVGNAGQDAAGRPRTRGAAWPAGRRPRLRPPGMQGACHASTARRQTPHVREVRPRPAQGRTGSVGGASRAAAAQAAPEAQWVVSRVEGRCRRLRRTGTWRHEAQAGRSGGCRRFRPVPGPRPRCRRSP